MRYPLLPQACGLNLQGQQAPARERLFFNYLSKAYQMWMAGHDTFDSLLADLGQGFGMLITLNVGIAGP